MAMQTYDAMYWPLNYPNLTDDVGVVAAVVIAVVAAVVIAVAAAVVAADFEILIVKMIVIVGLRSNVKCCCLIRGM